MLPLSLKVVSSYILTAQAVVRESLLQRLSLLRRAAAKFNLAERFSGGVCGSQILAFGAKLRISLVATSDLGALPLRTLQAGLSLTSFSRFAAYYGKIVR